MSKNRVRPNPSQSVSLKRPSRRRAFPAACLVFALLGGCVAASSSAQGTRYSLRSVPAPPVESQTLFGAYLSGNFAASDHDDASALGYYGEILRHDPINSLVAERSLSVAVDAGRFDLALPLARQLLKATPSLPLANLVVAVADMKVDDPAGASAAAKQLPNQGLFVLLSSVITAWSLAAEGSGGLQQVSVALQPLQQMQLGGLAVLNTALIEDLEGRDGAADRDYRVALSPGSPPLRLVELVGNFWERTGKRAQAAALYQAFAKDAGSTVEVAPHLSATPPHRLISNPAQGLAEAMFDVASLATMANATDISLLATRLSLVLRPDYPQAQFALAEDFAARGQIDAARRIYRDIAPSSPLAGAARMADVQLLEKLHRPKDAIIALDSLIAARPDEVEPVVLLGDVKRDSGDMAGAILAYDKAIAMSGPDVSASRLGSLYFSRGIAREQSGQWPTGEADLRHALILLPGYPELLNYLGFALVVRDEKLGEARALIEQAVHAEPNNAAYVDSLGWADYHLRHYRQAAAELEQATLLAPQDAEINDHLGDAYWRSGHRNDARLQWRRALSLSPDPTLEKTIRHKLDVGIAS